MTEPPVPPATGPAAPAGWYDDNGRRRYWNGKAWFDSAAEPEPDAPVAHPPLSGADHGWAWALVAVPIGALLVPLAFPTVTAWGVAAGAAVVNTIFAFRDDQHLKSRGVKGSGWLWALLFVPLYLATRIRRVGNPMILVSWVLAFLVSIVSTQYLGPVQLDANLLEQQLQQDVGTQLDVDPASVTIDCPDNPAARVNETVTCSAEDLTGTADVIVTVTGRDGSYTWQLSNGSYY